MPEKKHVVVVCGYGCHLDTPLKPYLDLVVEFITRNKPDQIIFCGGFTQRKSAPNISEAGLMYNYVNENLRIYYYYLEDLSQIESDSYTTLENIRQAAGRICLWQIKNRMPKEQKLKITIFCEAHRAPNVIMLARHFMMNLVESIDDITVETASWERADPFKQVKNLIYNHLALRFPYLARREHKRRLRRAEFI